MKKSKILAAILTFALLLSSLLLPVSAATTPTTCRTLVTDETLSTGTIVSAWGTPTLDCTKDSYYKEFGHAEDNLHSTSTSYSNGESFDVYFTNDDKYLYFYLDVTVPAKQAALKGHVARLYIDFYNMHESIYKTVNNQYQNEYFNSSNQTVYNGGQFHYTVNATSANNVTVSPDYNTRGAKLGNSETLANGNTLSHDVKVKASSYTESDTTYIKGYILEGRIVLPSYVRSTIAADKQPVIGVGYEIRQTDANNGTRYAMSYNDASMVLPATATNYKEFKYFGWIWGDYTVTPDVVLSKDASTNQKSLTSELTCINTLGSKFDIDGDMGDNEAWSELTAIIIDSQYGGTGTYANALATVRYGTDGKYIYVYFESLQDDVATTPVFDIIYLQFAFKITSTKSNSEIGDFLEARLAMTTEAEAENGGSWTRLVGHGDYDYISNDTANAETLGDTEFKLNTERTAVEYKIPLPEYARTALKDGTYDIGVNALARDRFNTSQDTNFVASEYEFNWQAASVTLTLPQTPDTAFVGVQKTDVTSGKYNMRFAAVMSQAYTNYDTAGFTFKYVDGPDTNLINKTAIMDCKYVYDSILVDGTNTAASIYGGDYFFCFTINDLVADKIYEFEVTPYVTANGSSTHITSDTVTLRFKVAADGTFSFQ